MTLINYSTGTRDRLYAHTPESLDEIKRKLLKSKISQLEREIYDNPSSKWESLPGPKCNYNRCSNIQGCGSECTCIPYGRFGSRCIPNCCMRTNNSPPCSVVYPNTPIQCALPCETFPIACSELYFNPYHKWQGGNTVSPNYPGHSGGWY
jgi:hypothetical protein